MFGNYADLVSRRAKMAADRKRKGLEQRAIDDYYTNLEKERLAAEAEAERRAQTAFEQAMGQGRSFMINLAKVIHNLQLEENRLVLDILI